MDDIDALLYTPGSFVCPKCGFRLEKRTMIAATGEVGIRKGGEDCNEACPNDGTAMERVTWKAAFEDAADSSHELMLALIESVKGQNYYAQVLNALDGGERRTFDCPAAWIARLVECGTIPKRER
jgi:hypothetical protein